MVRKKVIKKVMHKKTNTRVGTKKKNLKPIQSKNISQNTKKETVRVKTFIVEKPVYVQTPSVQEPLNPIQSQVQSKSQKIEEDNDFAEPLPDEEFDESVENEYDDEMNNSLSEEPVDYSRGASPKGHLRSRGLFKNIWWKKGLLKGFVIWFAVVIIFYIFDALGMVEVVDWKRWFFFLVLLLILGMTYQKFMTNKNS